METYKIHYLTNVLTMDKSVSVEAAKEAFAKIHPAVATMNSFFTEDGIRFAPRTARGKYRAYLQQYSQMGEEGGGGGIVCDMIVYASSKEDAIRQWAEENGPVGDYHHPTIEQIY